MFWSRKKPEEPKTSSKPVKSSGGVGIHRTIKYNPQLISSLMDEHRALLEIYGKVQRALDTKEYLAVAELLAEFRTSLKAHLLKEHIELYIYLEYALRDDRQAFDYMHSLRMEMDQISAQVMGFLHNYQATPVMAENARQFQEQLQKIAPVLKRRIRQEEETLYTLYTDIS